MSLMRRYHTGNQSPSRLYYSPVLRGFLLREKVRLEYNPLLYKRYTIVCLLTNLDYGNTTIASEVSYRLSVVEQ